MNSQNVSGQNIPQYSPFVTVSEESKVVLEKFKKINQGYFFKPDQTLVNEIKEMKASDLTNTLNCFFMDMLSTSAISDPAQFLDRLATLIPLEKMQEAVKDTIEDALKEAKSLIHVAKYHLELNEKEYSPTIFARLSSIFDAVISLIESIINTFGIASFFKPAKNDLDADFKSQKIMMLLSLFGMISQMVLPLVGAEKGAAHLAGGLLFIAALSVVFPYIKPKPLYLPAYAENWTKEVQSKGFIPQGRKESLDSIVNILKLGRHPILVGDSRVGKSLTAKALAAAIERGDYPELKGKIVFRINTKKLIDQKAGILGGGNDILNQISAAMGRHRNDIILVFDEIHMACKNSEPMADELKTFLDEDGDFPHVIGITTKEEYQHVKNNNAFSLRFDKVDIENTEKDETLKILNDTFLKSRSHPLKSDYAIEHIYEESIKINEAPQPTTALKILKECINKTEKTQQSETEKTIVTISNQILFLKSQVSVSRGNDRKAISAIEKLETKLVELQETLSLEQNELVNLFKSKELFHRITKEKFSTVIKISKIAQTTLSPSDEKQLKLFLLLHNFLDPVLESYIKIKSKKLHVKTVIDENLINEIIKK